MAIKNATQANDMSKTNIENINKAEKDKLLLAVEIGIDKAISAGEFKFTIDVMGEKESVVNFVKNKLHDLGYSVSLSLSDDNNTFLLVITWDTIKKEINPLAELYEIFNPKRKYVAPTVPYWYPFGSHLT